MKTALILAFILMSANLSAQYGYVKLHENDSLLRGYLRFYYPVSGSRGYELWKNKNDKHPRRLTLDMITELAIKKDTFKIFRSLTPFQNSEVYIELVRGQIISRGKVILYEIREFKNPNGIAPNGGTYIRDENFSITGFYMIEDRSTGYLKAISADKEKMNQTLHEFFPEKYLTKYREVKGKIKYKTIPDLVKLYNSKP